MLLELGVLGLLLLTRRPTLGRRLLILDFVLLYLLSVPPVAVALRASLEAYPPLGPTQIQQSGAQAIVVLGAGAWQYGLDYRGPTPQDHSLVRARYGAWLQRQTGLPVLIAGGGDRGAEGPAMRAVLVEMGVPADDVWMEVTSKTTWENGTHAAELLAPKGIKKILLVTQSWHMRRAAWVFRKAGFEVVAAPCDQTQYSMYSRGIFTIVPRAEVFYASSTALEEWIGNLFYRLRY